MIAVIDYGMGNLRSVSKALEMLGADVCISGDPDIVKKAEKIVLPGVGAFGDAMREITNRGFDDLIRRHISNGHFFLGICLGYQLLFETSEESLEISGLSIFPGTVVRFRSDKVKIPHMGWNSAEPTQTSHPMLAGIHAHDFFYFVHSYYPRPTDQSLCALKCSYGNETFAAAVGTSNVFATQFHPEKSQQAGLRLLKNFISWK